VIGFRQALRLLHINNVLGRHGLDEIIFATHLFRPVRFLQYLSPWRWFRREKLPRGVRIRRSLEDLGPIFISLVRYFLRAVICYPMILLMSWHSYRITCPLFLAVRHAPSLKRVSVSQ